MGPARLIGRRTQLAVLGEALLSASAGSTRCLIVTGEAGIGKTRLVAEALDGADARVVTGHAVDMATGEIPFGVLADTLRDLRRKEGADVLTPAERQALAPLLPGSVPGARAERVQLLSAFVDMLERLAADRLLVWVVEDLHWADSATRDMVNLAVRTVRGRFLLIATVRTEDPLRASADNVAVASYVAGLAATPSCEVVSLGRLSAEEVHEQLSGLLGTDLPSGVAARIERLSDGVPFVVEELAAVAGRPALATVSAVASGRLAGLSPEARRLVDAVAIGDGHLRLSLVEHVVDATAEELDTILLEAVRAGILVTDTGDDFLGFRHALLRDAADRTMGPGARRSWHRRWAEVLEANRSVLAADPAALAVAEHWHHARDTRRALAATVAAIPAAERLCLPEEEVVLWTRILRAFSAVDDAEAVAGMSPREAVARGHLACPTSPLALWREFLAAVPRERLTPAEDHFLRVLEEEKDAGKGEVTGLPEDSVVALADAFEQSPADRFAISVWARAGARLLSDPERGAQLLRRAFEGARALGDPRWLLAVTVLGSFQAQISGNPQQAASLIRESLAECGDLDLGAAVFVLGNLTWCEVVMGHHDLAEAAADAALARLKHPHLHIAAWEHVVENAAASWVMTGQWERARALLEKSARWWEDDLRTSNARLDLLHLMQRGACDDLSRWVEHLARPAFFGAPRAVVRDLLARAAATAGDVDGMRAVLSPAWTDDQVLFDDDVLWGTVLVAARAEADAALAGPRDDRQEALAHLQIVAEVAGRFRRYGDLGEIWPLDLAAQLDRFHGRDARPALTEALAGWERIGHVPDVAITHLSLAEQHAMLGDREAARSHLAAAREIAVRLDARPMLRRSDCVIVRYGLTTRERRADTVLTARETEVLGMLAEGRTNAEIARTLFMSPKTASVHVSRIIAKLGATNRTEAAAMARRRGLLVD